MAKKNKQKNNSQRSARKLFSISAYAQRTMFGVGMLAAAGIFLFSFFGKAGGAGQLFFSLFSFLMGKTVFLVPLLFVLAGLVFLGMKGIKPGPILFAMVLLGVGVEGMVASAARANSLNVEGTAGVLGLILSWPGLGAFGVCKIIF